MRIIGKGTRSCYIRRHHLRANVHIISDGSIPQAGPNEEIGEVFSTGDLSWDYKSFNNNGHKVRSLPHSIRYLSKS